MTTQRRKVKLHLLRKLQAREETERKRKRRFDFWSMIVFVGALLLLVWAIEIYRRTFINWRSLVAPTVIGALLAVSLLWRKLVAFGYPVWTITMIGVGIGSSLPYFGFLYINERFTKNEKLSEAFAIEKTGRFASGRRGCGKPYAVINFYGLTKDIVFSCNDIYRIVNCSKVRITYCNGFFGYNIIMKKSLEP